ncbi:hypothetical protein POM88_004614 [Heracleum sosnowskyi]|uniref:Pentatricopeptide repeat-containing protein n=1 Tax=Heracleum sosnowskyi TaxID=360622 RepID=A0AAD8JIQ6_9APIA|nr:hypothetical protein POM88_004614 [Heracleum sosnowskyi]
MIFVLSKSAESVLREILDSGSVNFSSELFEALVYSYRVCDSSPRVFDLVFKTGDIAVKFYKEMQRSRISSNVYTFNMVVAAYCKLGKLENAVSVFKEMESLGFNPTVASYNTLIQKGMKIRIPGQIFKTWKSQNYLLSVDSEREELRDLLF